MIPDKAKMADRHEEFLAALNGGRRSRGSGNQWRDAGDGRNDATEEEFAFCWDGKSTLGKGINVTREMLEKIMLQAGPERPMLGLRFYGDERLTQVDHDWVAVRAADWGELLETAREPGSAELRELLQKAQMAVQMLEDSLAVSQERVAELEAARQQPVLVAGEAKWTDEDLERFRKEFLEAVGAQASPRQEESPPPAPGPAAGALVPQLPWVSVFVTTQDYVQHRTVGIRYREDGHTEQFAVSSVRAEPYGQGKRLFVNDVIVRHGDLWIDGRLDTRVGAP